MSLGEFLRRTRHQIHHVPLSKLIDLDQEGCGGAFQKTRLDDLTMFHLFFEEPQFALAVDLEIGLSLNKNRKTSPEKAAQTCDGFESVSIFELPQDDSMRTSKHVPTILMEESKIPASKRNQIDHISTHHHHLKLYISKKNSKKSSFLRFKTKKIFGISPTGENVCSSSTGLHLGQTHGNSKEPISIQNATPRTTGCNTRSTVL